MIDSCSNIINGDQFYNFLTHNFYRHFDQNRAPLGLFFHAAWLKNNPEYLDAFLYRVDEVTGIEVIDFAFDVYDFKGDGKVDAFYAGDLIRACNLNPTLRTIEEVGGQSEKGKKTLTKAEV